MKIKAKRSLSLLMLTLTLMMSLELPAFAACNHQWSDWEIETEATCVEPGEKTRYCEICFEEERKAISATGKHAWDDWWVDIEPTCTKSGKKSRYCYECFEEQVKKIPATGKHDWGSWETVNKPTYYKSGKKVRYCDECGKKQVKAIPKKVLSKTEKKAATTATDLLKYAKKYNVKKMKKQFISPPKNVFFEKKVALAKYCKKYNQKKLSYKIRSVSIDQKDATVKLDVTYPDAYYPFGYSYYDLVYYLIEHPKCSDKAMFKQYMKYLSKYTKRFGVGNETKTITFKLKKTKKGWKITKSSDAIKNAINCNHEEAYSDVLG